jgi:pantoate--beta-alanine ligase
MASFPRKSTALQIARTKRELPANLPGKVGFVPTMGALHEGHAALVRKALAECDTCVLSIFVNPLQFGPKEDFDRYPRPLETDLSLAKGWGVHWAFVPDVQEMYSGRETTIRVAGLSEMWELFHLAAPDIAYFGLKDYQQCAVIRRMVNDLNFRLDLSFVETVRESDGLALSSRNAYLDSEERRVAPLLFQALQEASRAVREAGENPEQVKSILQLGREKLQGNGFEVAYFELVDDDDLAPIPTAARASRLIAAARLGAVRLIDNCAV